MNILLKANEIITERAEEKERSYGPFIECNEKAAKIASILCSKEISTEDIYKFQIALKLARESYCHKEDNLLDAVAYLGALNNFHENIEPEQPEPEDDNIKCKSFDCKNCTLEFCSARQVPYRLRDLE